MTTSPDRIPDALAKLMESKLDTLEKLELVIMLHEAGAPVSVTDAARELQIGTDVLRRMALQVQRTRLLTVKEDLLQLTSRDGELQAIQSAHEIYRGHRHILIERLSAIAMNRLRSMAARSFADAFRIRKKDDNDG